MADIIGRWSKPGDRLLDPFAGAGATLIAAEHMGRTSHNVELSPHYCDVIAHRFERVTGVTPLLNGKPHTFKD